MSKVIISIICVHYFNSINHRPRYSWHFFYQKDIGWEKKSYTPRGKSQPYACVSLGSEASQYVVCWPITCGYWDLSLCPEKLKPREYKMVSISASEIVFFFLFFQFLVLNCGFMHCLAVYLTAYVPRWYMAWGCLCADRPMYFLFFFIELHHSKVTLLCVGSR